MSWRLAMLVPLFAGFLLLGPAGTVASAQDDAMSVADEGAALTGSGEAAFAIDHLFLFFCAGLVLWMQAGFAMVEAGFNSSRHTVNILFKSVLNLGIGVLVYFLIGYHLMYPADGPLIPNVVGSIEPGIAGGPSTDQIHFLFRAAIAVVTAAIVSGAVAGRMKFGAFVVYGTVVAALLYPTIGYWTWGGGWLHRMGFYDVAGSGVVHMTGGFAGLAGAIVLGPRLGRYTSDGKPIAIPGHSLPLATLGLFILLVGWFGLNTGGQALAEGAVDTRAVMLVAVNTTLAACAGCCVSTFLSWILFGKPDLSMALNGLLGGLVAIAASCDGVTNLEAIVVGGIAGAIIVPAIILLDKLRIDDPVGAFPVHGVGGMWGLVACAIFGSGETWGGPSEGVVFGNWAAQLTGLAAIAATAFLSMFALFGLMKAAGVLRVSPEEEVKGLDISEHGMSAYAA